MNNMKNKVFWIGVEYNYSKDSPDFNKLKGGYVYAFVKAVDVRDVLSNLFSS